MGLKAPSILVIDLGSQYTLVIGRTLRELGIRSAILPPGKAGQWLETNKPKGIILSGGSASVGDTSAPTPPATIIDQHLTHHTPILGICYGMQWLATRFDGRVDNRGEHKEYGNVSIKCDTTDLLFRGLAHEQSVWASHGDSIKTLPPRFIATAHSNEGKTIVGMRHRLRKIWGVLFHPEVIQTPNGKQLLQNFLAICNCDVDWKPTDIVQGIQDEVAQVTSDKRAIIGFSGGVDSTTLTRILSPVLRDRLHAICIDTGGLREGEIGEIASHAFSAGANLRIVRAAGLFLKALQRIQDAERKRKAFKRVYRSILISEAKTFDADFVVQGTLATDIIESGKVGQAALIKSHHNVGLKFPMPQLHPFQDLFKYEIRELSRSLGLPPSVSERHPFPGPGLFIRVIGAPATRGRIQLVREADDIVRSILIKRKLMENFSQLVVALGCIPTVGVKGDGRVYKPLIMIRAVETADFMTAVGHQFPPAVRREITSAVTRLPDIVRVMWDETDKPPATTEFE